MRAVRAVRWGWVGIVMASAGCGKAALPDPSPEESPAPVVATAKPNPPKPTPVAVAPPKPLEEPAKPYAWLAGRDAIPAVKGTEVAIAPPPRLAGVEVPTAELVPVEQPAVALQPPATEAKEAPKDPKDPKDKDKPFEWPKDVDGKNLAEYIKDFDSKDPAVRESAAKVIPAFGPDSRKTASRGLVRLITDPDPGVRIAAITSVSTIGLETREEVQPAVNQLRLAMTTSGQGSVIKLYATRSIAAFGTDGMSAIGTLMEISTDPWWETRQGVANALGKLGGPQYDDKPATDPAGRPIPKKPASEGAQRTLRTLLQKDSCAQVRLEAAYALLAIGPPHPKSGTPEEYKAMVKLNQDAITTAMKTEKDKAIQIWLHMLNIVYDDNAVDTELPKIAGYLQMPDPLVRVHALNAIAIIGPRAKIVVAAVQDALNYEEQPLVAAAVACLASIGKDAAPAIPELEKLKTKTKDDAMKKLVTDAIAALQGKKFGPEVVEPKKEEPKKDTPKK